jgi:predicted heme/steroid binding protein
MPFQEFTLEELSLYDGKHGKPAYVAYQGKIYDVSHSFLWRKGEHQVLHRAGCDLTKELVQAPHGADLLDKFPIVGALHSG